MNIEDRFKDAFENFEVDPGDQLWAKIQSEIPTSPASSVAAQAASTGAKIGSTWLTTAIVGSAIVITSVAGYFYFEKEAEARKEKTEKIISQEAEVPTISKEESINSEQNIQETAEAENTELIPENNQEKIQEKRSLDPAINENAPKTKPIKEKQQASQSEMGSKEKIASTIAESVISNSTETAQQQVTANHDLNSKDAGEAVGNKTSSSDDQAQTSSPSSSDIGKVEDHDNQPEPNDPNTVALPLDEEVDHGILAVQQFKPMNAFSPNGDGINDIFMVNPDSLEALGVTAISIKIFSPSTGRLIHQWNDKYGYWDGRTSSGTKAPDGPYFYQMILVKDGKEIPKQGTITISK